MTSEVAQLPKNKNKKINNCINSFTSTLCQKDQYQLFSQDWFTSSYTTGTKFLAVQLSIP